MNEPFHQQPMPDDRTITMRQAPALPGAPVAPATGPIPVYDAAVAAAAAVQTLPGYRFVVADDAQAWSGSRLLDLPEGDQLDAFDQLTGDGSALVVICGSRQVASVRRASALARSRSQARVAVVPLQLGPLGQSVLTLMAQHLVASVTTRPVSELIAWLPTAAGSVLDIALVSSVSRLDHPGITVRHHLLSYLPGRHEFVVQITPDPAVARVNRRGELRPSPSNLQLPGFDDRYGAVVTVAGPRPIPAPVLRYCRTSTSPSARPTTPQLREFWGDPEATEVVVAPADVIHWALDRLPSPETWPCAWCNEPLAAPMSACLFCGNSVR